MRKSNAILSLGLFGRLSSLVVSEDDFIDRFCIRKALLENVRFVSEREKKAEAIIFRDQLFPNLINELIHIVESVVLSDEIDIFYGIEFNSAIDKMKSPSDRFPLPFVGGNLQGWDSFMVFRDQADTLFTFVQNNFKTNKLYHSNKKLLDIYQIIQVATDARDFRFTLNEKGIVDFDKLALPKDDSDEEYCVGLDYIADLLKYIDLHLGDDWALYKDYQSKSMIKFPDLFYNNAIYVDDRRMSVLFCETLLNLSLFDEIVASSYSGAKIFPSLSNLHYFNLLGNRVENQIEKMRSFTSRGYDDALIRNYKDKGVTFTHLLVPQLMGLCLSEANTIKEILKNAIKLRGKSWIVEVRKYIQEIANEERPEKFIKIIRKLSSYTERIVSQQNPLILGNIGISTSGSITFSLLNIIENLELMRNPVVMYNTRSRKALLQKKPLEDLSRIFNIPQSRLVNYLGTSPGLQLKY